VKRHRFSVFLSLLSVAYVQNNDYRKRTYCSFNDNNKIDFEPKPDQPRISHISVLNTVCERVSRPAALQKHHSIVCCTKYLHVLNRLGMYHQCDRRKDRITIAVGCV